MQPISQTTYDLNKELLVCYPPASKESREVVNLTERKNLPTLVYGVKEFVCLSVCLSVLCLPQKMGKWVNRDSVFCMKSNF